MDWHFVANLIVSGAVGVFGGCFTADRRWLMAALAAIALAANVAQVITR